MALAQCHAVLQRKLFGTLIHCRLMPVVWATSTMGRWSCGCSTTMSILRSPKACSSRVNILTFCMKVCCGLAVSVAFVAEVACAACPYAGA